MLVQWKSFFSSILWNLYVWLLVIGSLLSVSSNNWVIIWVGLELNMISFLGLMSESSLGTYLKWGLYENKLMFSSVEASSLAKYFLAQSVGTGIFLVFPLSAGSPLLFGGVSSSLFLVCGLMLKGGVAPLHQWFPSVCSNISWNMNLILMTWQKVAPLFILSQVFSVSFFMVFLGGVNLFFGVLGALGQSQFRLILAYSSIAHMGWMISMMYFSTVSFFCYFFCYLLVIIPVLGVLSGTSLFSFKDLTSACIGRFNVFSLTLYLLSVSGVPPFLGFFMKAYALYSMALYLSFAIAIIFCLFAAVSLGYYLSMFFMILLSTSYSMGEDYIWDNGMMMSEEASVWLGYYFLGLFSLLSFPFLGGFVL